MKKIFNFIALFVMALSAFAFSAQAANATFPAGKSPGIVIHKDAAPIVITTADAAALNDAAGSERIAPAQNFTNEPNNF